MDEERIIFKILHDLDNGDKISFKHYKDKYEVEEELLLGILEVMKDGGLIKYDYIEDHLVYNGYPTNIELTKEGKRVIKENEDKLFE